MGYLLKFERHLPRTARAEKPNKRAVHNFTFRYDVDNFTIYGMYGENNNYDSESLSQSENSLVNSSMVGGLDNSLTQTAAGR